MVFPQSMCVFKSGLNIGWNKFTNCIELLASETVFKFAWEEAIHIQTWTTYVCQEKVSISLFPSRMDPAMDLRAFAVVSLLPIPDIFGISVRCMHMPL